MFLRILSKYTRFTVFTNVLPSISNLFIMHSFVGKYLYYYPYFIKYFCEMFKKQLNQRETFIKKICTMYIS